MPAELSLSEDSITVQSINDTLLPVIGYQGKVLSPREVHTENGYIIVHYLDILPSGRVRTVRAIYNDQGRQVFVVGSKPYTFPQVPPASSVLPRKPILGRIWDFIKETFWE